MELSVIIATYNRTEQLRVTLDSVFSQSLPPDQYEVVVTVDGSTDGTTTMLHSLRPACRLVVIEQPNLGQGVAQKNAVLRAEGRLLLFIDDDMICDPDLLAHHAAHHLPGKDIVVLGITPFSPSSPRTFAAELVRSGTAADFARCASTGPQLPRDAMVSNNSSVRRSTFLAYNFRDEFSRHLQDVDPGWRLWKAGVEFVYEPRAVTHHVYIKTDEDLVRCGCQRGISEVRMCRAHPDFRPFSYPASFFQGRTLTRLGRMAGMRVPALLGVPLWSLFYVAKTSGAVPAARPIGLRLLKMLTGIAIWRGVLAESGGWDTFQKEFGQRLPVLLYHHIGCERPGAYPSLTVEPRRFEQHMRWLSTSGYSTITPSDWLAWRNEGKALPRRPVMITFDDAYADLCKFAFPTLKKYGLRATVFVVTDLIGRTNEWDENRYAQFPLMSELQLREWVSEGVIELGAHSRTHPDLTSLQSDEELIAETRESREILEVLVGRPVVSFAYPYGCYHERSRNTVSQAFDLAFTTQPGLNNLGTDPSLMRRIEIMPGDTTTTLATGLRSGWRRTLLHRAARVVIKRLIVRQPQA
jgi:peptidoglycan/xylan/chitin deacetylase (PgdA/CDA1 family)